MHGEAVTGRALGCFGETAETDRMALEVIDPAIDHGHVCLFDPTSVVVAGPVEAGHGGDHGDAGSEQAKADG